MQQSFVERAAKGLWVVVGKEGRKEGRPIVGRGGGKRNERKSNAILITFKLVCEVIVHSQFPLLFTYLFN